MDESSILESLYSKNYPDIEKKLNQGQGLQATDICGNSLLAVSIKQRDDVAIELIMGFKPDLNQTNKLGQSILHHTIQAGNLPLFVQMVKEGANLRIITLNGWSLADYCIKSNMGLFPYLKQMFLSFLNTHHSNKVSEFNQENYNQRLLLNLWVDFYQKTNMMQTI